MNVHIAHTKEDRKKLATICLDWGKEMGYDYVEETVMGYLAQRDLIVWVSENDVPVGLITGDIVQHFWMKKPMLAENWLFVRPDYRHKGAATHLLTMFEAWASVAKCDSVLVTPNKNGTSKPEIAAGKLQACGYDTFGYIMRKEI